MSAPATPTSQLWDHLLAQHAITPLSLHGILTAGGVLSANSYYTSAAAWLRNQNLVLRLEQVVDGWRYELPHHLRGDNNSNGNPTRPGTNTADQPSILDHQQVRGVGDLGFLFDAALSKQQFDTLKFGLFLDEAHKLLMVAIKQKSDVSAPGSNNVTNPDGTIDDDEDDLAGGKEAVATASSANTGVLSKDHEYIVLQLVDAENGGVSIVPVFRLVFRNEAATVAKSTSDEHITHQAKYFPLFRLRSVFVSQTSYYGSCDEIAAAERTIEMKMKNTSITNEYYWQEQQNNAISEARGKGQFDGICAMWVAVLSAIATASMAARPADSDALEDPYVAESIAAVKASTTRALQQLNECGVCCPYRTSATRMKHRVLAVHKTSDLIADWREGVLAAHAGGATMARIIFKETRNGRNYVEADELVAFLPQDTDIDRRLDSEEAMSPKAAAFARLRLWILKALITAEVNNVHQLLLEVDYPMIISQCIGFMELSNDQKDLLMGVMQNNVAKDQEGMGAQGDGITEQNLDALPPAKTGKIISQSPDGDFNVQEILSVADDPPLAGELHDVPVLSASSGVEPDISVMTQMGSTSMPNPPSASVMHPHDTSSSSGATPTQHQRPVPLDAYVPKDAPAASPAAQQPPVPVNNVTEEELKLRNAMFHISRIVVETVEDFVQHSGVVWRVILMTKDEANVMLMHSLLDCVQGAKVEMEAHLSYLSVANDPATQTNKTTNDGALVEVEENQGAIAAIDPSTTSRRPPVDPASSIHKDILNQASSRNLRLGNDSLFDLFHYLDVNDDGVVSVSELTKLFLCKENRIAHYHERKNKMPYRRLMTIEEEAKKQDKNLAKNPLTALDGCGLPFDEESISKFILSFCKGSRVQKRHLKSKSSDSCQHGAGEEGPKMNFTEFSIMMLNLAKR